MTTMTETPEQIVHYVLKGYGMLDGTRASASQKIVDALRAAGLLVSPPTGDERERLARILCKQQGDDWARLSGTQEVYRNRYLKKADAILGSGFRLVNADTERIAKLEAERDAALAAIGRVRAVAMQHRSVEQHNEMVPVTDIVDLIREQSSADYLAALDGAPEPEHNDSLNRASAWSDYRSEYGVHGTQSHRDFCAGWDAARGTLDIGGVQR